MRYCPGKPVEARDLSSRSTLNRGGLLLGRRVGIGKTGDDSRDETPPAPGDTCVSKYIDYVCVTRCDSTKEERPGSLLVIKTKPRTAVGRGQKIAYRSDPGFEFGLGREKDKYKART